MIINKKSIIIFFSLFVYVALCFFYIERTSFTFEGNHIYSLWDDAMISMRYAKNLAYAGDFSWNIGGDRVQGFSNLGVTLFMALIHLLPISIYKTAFIIQLSNIVMLLGIIILSYKLALILFKDISATAPLTAIMVALYAPLTLWCLQGADAGFIALLILAPLYLVALSVERGQVWNNWVFILLGLGIVVRQDFSIIYILFFCASLTTKPNRLFVCWQGLSIFLFIWAVLLIFSKKYYGDWLPNTYYLKTVGYSKLLMLKYGFFQYRWFIIPIILLGLETSRSYRHNIVVWLCFGIVFCVFAYTVWIGGDWATSLGGRYTVQVMPIYIALTVGFLLNCLKTTSRHYWAKLVSFIPLAVLCLFSPSTEPGPSPIKAVAEWINPAVKPMFWDENNINLNYGLFLQTHTASNTKVGLHWAGITAYFTDRPVVDLLGKSDRHIAKMVVDIFVPGHSKWDWDYVMKEIKPDIFIGESRGLAERSDFQSEYLYAAFTENPKYPGFFVRRSSIQKIK